MLFFVTATTIAIQTKWSKKWSWSHLANAIYLHKRLCIISCHSRGHNRLMLLSVCRNVVNSCNTKEAAFSSVWAVVFFESQIPIRVSKLFFSFSQPTIDKNTGFRLRNAVQIHRHKRSCHFICVALSCHSGCHEVGLKVIVFVYTCNVCYAVVSFFYWIGHEFTFTFP